MKKLKQLIAVGLLLLMMVSVLTGCSADELKYWDQSVKLYKLGLETDMFTSGEMKFNFDSKQIMPADIDQEDVKKMMPLIALLEKGSIRYEMGQSISKDQQDIKLFAKADPTAAYVPCFEVTRVNQVNYIKIAPIRNFVETYLPTEKSILDTLNTIPKEVEYIEMSDASLVSELNKDSSITNTLGVNYSQQMLKMNQGEQAKMVEPFIQVLDDLVRKGYDGYSMNIVRQDGNKFVVSLQFNEIGQILSRLLNFSLDHSDQVQKSLFDGMRKVPASALATLVAAETLTEADKNKAINDMQVMTKEMLKDTSEIKAEMNLALKEMDKGIQDVMGKSKITMEMELVNPNQLKQTVALQLDFKDPQTDTAIKMDVIGAFDTQYNATLNIQKPEGKGITLEALNALLPKTYTIYVDDYFMTINNALGDDSKDLEIYLIKNIAYLHIDDLNLFTDKPVTINKAKNYAEVKLNDKLVQMPILKVKNEYLFKIKNLDRLGYKTQWLPEDRAIQVTK